jgi:hypothetical protein
MSREKCVWVHEIGVLKSSGRRIALWDIWAPYNTKKEAKAELRWHFRNRPRWVTAEFHRATNRIRKYIPAKK